VEVIGRLPDYLTRTGFRVTPVIGVIQPPLELVPDAREVDEVFEVPLAFLLDERNHQRATRELNGRTVGFYVIEHQGRTIWGATAHYLLHAMHGLLALVFNVAVLYLTLGFRQFSHYFTDIQLAVKSGDIERARSLLEQWRGASGVVRNREEVIRLTIEEALLA